MGYGTWDLQIYDYKTRQLNISSQIRDHLSNCTGSKVQVHHAETIPFAPKVNNCSKGEFLSTLSDRLEFDAEER